MKKFESNYYGLLPIYLADQRFMQDATAEQLEALLMPWLPYATANSFILSGIEPDPIIPTGYTAGWLVIDSKIYRCNEFLAGLVPTGQQRVWTIVENNLTGGAKVPKRSLTPVETWKEFTAEPDLVADSETEIIPFALPRMADLIAAMQARTYFTRTVLGSYRLQFIKSNDGYVHVSGSIMPDMSLLSSAAPAQNFIIAFPYVLDSSFKEGFDYESILTVYPLDALGTTDHEAKAYKAWISFTTGAFTLRLTIEEASTAGYSGDHRGIVHFNAILKLA